MKIVRRRMILEVARLEMKLVLRNRAVRYYAVTGTVVFTTAAGLMLNYPGAPSDLVGLVYVASMFAPLTYGLLAFSWNASNGASLFNLPIAPSHHLVGRLLVAWCLAVPPAGALCIAAAALKPELVLLPAASGLFAVTVLSVPFFLVSVVTPRKLDADAPPLSDMRRFGGPHYAAAAAALIPELVVTRLASYEQFVAVLSVAALCGLAALPAIVRYSSKVLAGRIPRLSDELLAG